MDCSIDYQSEIGSYRHPERHWNTSLRFAPPAHIIDRAVTVFGTPRLVRVFITLDEFWDFRDDSFHENYRIGVNRYQAEDPIHDYDRGRTKASDVYFTDYLKSIGAIAETVLLCFRRYEHEVMNGTISWADYEHLLDRAIRHVRTHCPQLRWIEITNESEWSHFGGLDDDAYITLYSHAAAVIQAINSELPAEEKLLIGGPVCSTSRKDRIPAFLERLQAAGDLPCDFISLHDYDSGERPNQVSEVIATVREQLRTYDQPADLPIIMSECGTWEGKQRLNENMASGMPIVLEQAADDDQLIFMPWCLYHDPDIQLASTMLLPDGRLTPWGNSMRLYTLHGERALRCSCPLRDGARGVHVRASRRDDGGICIQCWNYEEAEESVMIDLLGLPAGAWRCRSYRIDQDHSNCLRQPESDGELACLSDERHEADALSQLQTKLPTNAIHCWLIEAS